MASWTCALAKTEPIESRTYVYLAIFTVVGWIVATVVYRRYARFVPLWV